jgi:hypothetical protein
MIINNNDGKPIGFIETLISNERVITLNATQHATTITTRDRANGHVRTETCCWLFLASSQFCGKPGHPYCAEHQLVLDYIRRLDDDCDEILATHRAICEEPMGEEQQLCTVCNHRPVHNDCVYCEQCCAEDPLEVLGPQG